MLNKCQRIPHRQSFQTSIRRFITANQAATALRPFFFCVHPDRFAKMPDLAQKNTKALQAFNGYLNELFPDNKQRRIQPPIRVNFSIMKQTAGEFEEVSLILQGTDPIRIIR
jgi:hypothetical protein